MITIETCLHFRELWLAVLGDEDGDASMSLPRLILLNRYAVSLSTTDMMGFPALVWLAQEAFYHKKFLQPPEIDAPFCCSDSVFMLRTRCNKHSVKLMPLETSMTSS